MYRILLGIVLFIGFINAEDTTYDNVTELYIATFDRAPDGGGLVYWVDESELSLEETSISFFDQLETKEKYPSSLSTIEFVQAVYNNLFDRNPDEAGLNYWAGELEGKTVSRSIFILAVINGAINDDAKILQNKTTIGLEFARTGSRNLESASLVLEGITAEDDSLRVSRCLSGLGECPLKKTGQTKSYNGEGEVVSDGTIKDDGFYQKGDLDYKFRDVLKETVVDNVTGLEWQDNKYRGDDYYSDYNKVIEYCQDLKLGGYSNWRLPTVSQLSTIVDRSKYKPTIDDIFIYTSLGGHMTLDGWEISFYNGSISKSIYYSFRVRCVRTADKMGDI